MVSGKMGRRVCGKELGLVDAVREAVPESCQQRSSPAALEIKPRLSKSSFTIPHSRSNARLLQRKEEGPVQAVRLTFACCFVE
jgi:hypothetical protein